jgi:hypothetical protein
VTLPPFASWRRAAASLPGASVDAASLVADCLRRDPALRPPFSEIDRRLAAIDDAGGLLPAAAAAPGLAVTRGVRRPSLAGGQGSGAVAAGGVSTGRRSSLLDRMEEGALRRLFPAHVAAAMRRGERAPPERKEMVTVFFADIVGFTTLSATMPAEKVPGQGHV